nr:proline-rich protein HaeIII subfamily 1-like [Loxodonta africana]
MGPRRWQGGGPASQARPRRPQTDRRPGDPGRQCPQGRPPTHLRALTLRSPRRCPRPLLNDFPFGRTRGPRPAPSDHFRFCPWAAERAPATPNARPRVMRHPRGHQAPPAPASHADALDLGKVTLRSLLADSGLPVTGWRSQASGSSVLPHKPAPPRRFPKSPGDTAPPTDLALCPSATGWKGPKHPPTPLSLLYSEVPRARKRGQTSVHR